MGLELEYRSGQTPIDDDEKEGLLIPAIASRAELDEFEQQNIEAAVQWTLMRNFTPEEVFTERFVKNGINGCTVMFGDGLASIEKPIKTSVLING